MIKNNFIGLKGHLEKLDQVRLNYESFFNTIDEFLWVLDKKGNITHMNSTVITRLGYTKEELIGKSVLIVHPPERRDEANKIVGEMLNGKAEFCPVPIQTKSGVKIQVETRVTLGNWDDKPAIFGISKDISKVRLSEEKFSKVFHINPSACGLSDIENQQYVEVNDAFYTLFGFEKDEVIGKTATELGIFTDKARSALLEKIDKNGKAINIEADLKAKNGDIKHVLLSAENIYIQDKKYRFTVVNDITELMQSENKIKKLNDSLEQRVIERTEQIEAANKELEAFSYSVSHDLRAPLRSINGFAHILMEDYLPQLDDEAKRICGVIQNNSQKMGHLIDSLLEFSRSGRAEINKTVINTRELIDSIYLDNTDIAVREKIDLQIGDVCNVFADSILIKQVWTNLITNAIKYSSKSENPTISITCKNEKDFCIFCVNDNGVGFDMDHANKLFGVFQRLHTNEEFEGSGVGLAIIHQIIKRHGGKVWAYAEVNKGAEFYFSLPLLKKE